LDNSAISTPQPGYIGRKYSNQNGLVIIGANPGIPNVSPFIQKDPIYIQHIQNFARNKDYDQFLQYLDYTDDYMKSWRNNLTNAHFRELLGYNIEEIAYINLVKCRSIQVGSNTIQTLGNTVTRRCFNLHTIRQLNLLKPRWIIGQWKQIPKTLHSLGYDIPKTIPCYSGQRNLTEQARIKDIYPFFWELRNDHR
jgi:hypothetical protein